MALKAAGFTLVALTPAPDARDLEEFLAGGTSRKIALLVGHEGGGLSPLAQGVADVRVRIGMVPGVDSLNVTTATGIALYRIYESSE
jgi:tRNA G18 (ribose-2'-O)-methylase SpoU